MGFPMQIKPSLNNKHLYGFFFWPKKKKKRKVKYFVNHTKQFEKITGFQELTHLQKLKF